MENSNKKFFENVEFEEIGVPSQNSANSAAKSGSNGQSASSNSAKSAKNSAQTAASSAQNLANAPLLKICNLSILMKDRFLLKNISLEANSGDCIALIGEDGSGKTSLLKAIAGSLPINSDQIFISGQDISENRKALAGVRMCYDPPVFFKYQSVYANLKFLTSLSWNFNKAELEKVLERFNMKHRMHTKVLFLSYQERKMMSLAFAFLLKPKILLLDEPFKSLPDENYDIVKKAIVDIRKQGTLILITSRNLRFMEKICNRFVFMQDREILQSYNKPLPPEFEDLPFYAFVKVKYPHYVGKILIDTYGLRVKIFHNRVLFEGDEKLVTEIVLFLVKNKIIVYGAGFIDDKSERIFTSLTPYFREEKR